MNLTANETFLHLFRTMDDMTWDYQTFLTSCFATTDDLGRSPHVKRRFLEKTSTDDYANMLLETSIGHGTNIRELARDMSVSVPASA